MSGKGKKLVVIAFGGNALQKPNGKGTFEEQLETCYETCKHLIPLFKEDWNIILTHGNGPQVGVKILKEIGGEQVFKLPKFPMFLNVAETQCQIGYLIEAGLTKVLEENKIERKVMTVMTRVEVSAEDPAFQNPAKPVGLYYGEEDVKKMTSENPSWVFKEDAKQKGKFRRVVPSPRPFRIQNIELIEQLARAGNVVICVGGGGIPVVKKGVGLEGIDAVIDKDLASSVLAQNIGAEEFRIFTDISNAFINFGKESQEAVYDVEVKKMRQYFEEGHFGAGSMGPKVKAVMEYVENSKNGGIATITSAESAAKGDKGTVVKK